MAPLFKDLSPPIFPQPVLKLTGQDSSGNSIETGFDKEVYNERIKLWIKEENKFESTTQALFNVIFEQCSELTHNRLLAKEDYEDIHMDRNISALLKAIRAISCQVETNISIYDAVDDSKRRYYSIYQGEEETNATYLNDYRVVIYTLEY